MRACVGTIRSVLIVTCTLGSASALAANGPAGYWPLDGNGNDASGNGYTLTIEGGAAFGPGLFGQALSLTGQPTQYASGTGDDPSFDFGSNDFTIQTWVNLTQRTIQIFAEKFFGATGPGWTLYDAGDSIQFYADSGTVFLSGTPAVSMGSWHQVVVRRHGNDFAMYFDDQVVATQSITWTLQATSLPLLIGQRDLDDGRSFALNGSIDEVAIWDRALADGEIAYLYNGGAGNTASSLVAYYVVCRGTEDLRLVLPDGTVSVVASGFGDALSVAQLPAGNAYAGDLLVSDRAGSGTLWTIDPEAGVVAQANPGFNPNDLYVDSAGNIFASAESEGVFEQLAGASSWIQVSSVSQDLTSLTELQVTGGDYLFFSSASGELFRTTLLSESADDTSAQLAGGYAEIHGITTFGVGFLFATYATGTIYQASGVFPGETFGASVFAQAPTGVDADIFASDGEGGFVFTSQTSPGDIYRVDALGTVTPIVAASSSLSLPRGIVVDGAVDFAAPPPTLTVVPATATLSPLGSIRFAATGGSGTGYEWSLESAPSGGSITDGGVYTAGPAGNVIDVVKVADSQNDVATASVQTTSGVSISPSTGVTIAGGTLQFVVTGGTGAGFSCVVSRNDSVGATVSLSGASLSYTAGATGGTDVVTCVDSLGNAGTATITVEGSLAITPANPTVPVLASLQFMATGGSGQGYTWSFANAEYETDGSSLTPGGGYVAGDIGGLFVQGTWSNQTIDVVQVMDSAGNTATTNVSVVESLALEGTSPVAPGQSVMLTAEGGSGNGYAFTIATNGSGCSLADAGMYAVVYTAGREGETTDSVAVTDGIGDTASYAVSVGAGVTVSPASSSVRTGGGVVFTASGGTGAGFAWSMKSAPSGGTISDAGVYTAGASGGVTDEVQATDSLQNVGTATVHVLAAGGMDAGLSDGGLSRDAGAIDAGVMVDAGHAVDAGLLTSGDAGNSADAGGVADAGSSADAGAVVDAGRLADAGSSADAGAVADAGSSTDAGAINVLTDAGNSADAGSSVDAGGRREPSADAGSGSGAAATVPAGCGCGVAGTDPLILSWLLLALLARSRSRRGPRTEASACEALRTVQ